MGALRRVFFAMVLLLPIIACSNHPLPGTLVMDIESSPVNLDPRVGTDSQSQRIAELIFDPLVRKDEHFKLLPWVAESWDVPLDYIATDQALIDCTAPEYP